MKKSVAFVAFLAFCSVASAANVWYVDAVNGNDEWNGKVDYSQADPDNKIGPKKTLSVFTSLVSKGDTIYAAPGHYNDKTSASATNYRFYTTVGGISLIATGDASNTFIDGALDSTVSATASPYGCGDNAIVPVKMTGGNNLIRGFTIANGRQLKWENVGTYHGGGAVLASTDRMVDCVVTNCAAIRGGGVQTLGTALRCRFTGNYAQEGAHAQDLRNAVNCVFENTSGYVSYNNSTAATIVNCTFRGNKLGNFRSNTATVNVYNSILLKGGDSQPKNKRMAFFNCVFDFDPTKDPEGFGGTNGECRVVSTSSLKFNADGSPYKGNPAYQTGVSAYYDDNFPTGFDADEKLLDVNRNVRTVDGAIDLGAVERQADAVDGNEWFVDAVNGNDENSGKTPALAKQSLVSIMEGRVKGDVVYAAPGVYSNKTVLVGSQPYRVSLPAGVRLIGTEGAEKTTILGKASETPDSAYGTGPGAISCVYCGENDTSWNQPNICGFTLADGHSVEKNGTRGAAVRGYSRAAGIVADCVITNCATARGPVYYLGYVIRCRFYDNVTFEGAGGSIWDAQSVYDSYFRNSVSGASGNPCHDIYMTDALLSGAVVVNCTFESSGSGGPHAAGSNRVHVYNSLMRCKSDGGGAWYHNCVTGCRLETAPKDNDSEKDDATVVTNFDGIALTTTHHPVAGRNPAVGKGDYVTYTNLAPACIRDLLGKDVWGNPRLVDGQLDVGAVACDRPAVKVADASTGLVVTGLDVPKDGLWHDTEAGAAVAYTLARDFTSAKFMRGAYVNGELIDFNKHADDWTYAGTVPADGVLEISAYYPVVNDWYVDANNGNDENDGLTPGAAHAFKTLARAATNAVLVAYGENEHLSTVYVAEGVYDTGVVPAGFGGLTAADNSTGSRLYLRQASFVATGRREETIIEGASADTESGMGEDAVRCCLMRGGTLRGFTLRNGNVNVNPDKTDSDQGGGIRSTSTAAIAYDCEIYGCNAVRGGGAQGVQLVRCYVHDNTDKVTGVTPARGAAANDAYMCSGYNSVIKGDCYLGYQFLNCTCLGNCWGKGTSFANCYIGADGASGEAVMATFTNCVCAKAFKSFSPHAGCLENTPCTFDENWRPKRRLSPLVDAGDLDLYNTRITSIPAQYRDLDYAGGPRVIKQTVETIDVGAGERPYSEPMGVMLLVR